jgi:hypothetical protein
MKKINEKYLTEDEEENIKAVCSDEDERAVIRDMLDTGMTLQEALNKPKYWKNLKT